jgi:hypothetical protein
MWPTMVSKVHVKLIVCSECEGSASHNPPVGYAMGRKGSRDNHEFMEDNPMKTTTRLATLAATVVLVSGCTNGLRHHNDRPFRDPVQLPGAPKLEAGPAATGATTPNMIDAAPSPLSSTAPGGSATKR